MIFFKIFFKIVIRPAEFLPLRTMTSLLGLSVFLFSVILCAQTIGNNAAATPALTKTDNTDNAGVTRKERPPMSEGEKTQYEQASEKAAELLEVSDLPEGTREISLKEALSSTLERNLSLKRVRLELDKAGAKLKQARGLVLPMAQAEVQYVFADHPDEVDFGPQTIVVNPRNTVNGNITVRFPLVNLQSWKNLQIAKTGEALTLLSIEEARQSILFTTAQAYYTALMSLTLVNLYKDEISATQGHLRVAEEKYLAGSGLRIDLLRAGMDFEKAEESLQNARLGLAAACDALGMLTGLNKTVAPRPVEPLSAPGGNEDDLMDSAQSERVDVQLKEAQLALAEMQVSSAMLALAPTLDLIWQGRYQFTDPGDFGDTDRSRWNIILGLTIPIFNYYNYGKISEEKLTRRQAEIDIETLTQQVGQEVRQAQREYQTALINVQTAARQVALAEESLSLVEAAYAAGAGTSLEVTDARRMYLQAKVNLATNELQTQLALLQLLQSVGEKPRDLVR